MTGVPVAVVVEAASLFQNAVQLDTARAHVIDVGLGRFMSIFKAAFLFRLAPENLVIAVRVERRVDVNQIDARVWKFAELIEIIAAVDDARINYGRRLNGHLSNFA